MTGPPQDALVDLYAALLRGDEAAALAGFVSGAVVDSPRTGAVGAATWVESEMEWLSAVRATVEHGPVIRGGHRRALEVLLDADVDGGREELPVLLVADGTAAAITALRIYHSTWPLTGSHQVRGPVVAPVVGETPSGVVAAYEQALAAGDVDVLHSLFEPDGYVREPAGRAYTYAGPAREDFYGPLRVAGGVPLTVCTVTEGAACTVVEYQCDRWGGHRFDPQAGAAVWERSAAGKLVAVRIYDDLVPPEEVFGAAH